MVVVSSDRPRGCGCGGSSRSRVLAAARPTSLDRGAAKARLVALVRGLLERGRAGARLRRAPPSPPPARSFRFWSMSACAWASSPRAYGRGRFDLARRRDHAGGVGEHRAGRRCVHPPRRARRSIRPARCRRSASWGGVAAHGGPGHAPLEAPASWPARDRGRELDEDALLVTGEERPHGQLDLARAELPGVGARGLDEAHALGQAHPRASRLRWWWWRSPRACGGGRPRARPRP